MSPLTAIQSRNPSIVSSTTKDSSQAMMVSAHSWSRISRDASRILHCSKPADYQ